MTIKAEKSIYIKGGSANAVNGLQGAITLDSKGTTVVDGDILAKAATVSADFNGAGSSLTGAVITETSGTTTLGFSDGALWKAEGDSKVSELTLKGGVVDLNNHNVTAVNLDNNSAATIRLDAGAEKLGSFTVENKDVTADLNVILDPRGLRVENFDAGAHPLLAHADVMCFGKCGKLHTVVHTLQA